MAPARWQRVKAIFDMVMETPPAERSAAVESACQGDAELRREIESLLEAHDPEDSLLDRPAAERLQAGSMEGRRLGAYRILREIGRGGMGAVYLGVRDDDQFQRCVAVKTVRADLVDEPTRQRFQRERETLAILSHPSIVTLLDSGTAEDGTPYLVMDYVEGVPIDRYCDTRKLSLSERLTLFRIVCGAIHYAHQNLVVHRDLKPANIIVTAEGIPKVLDFGIAKLLRPEFSAATMGLTRTAFQPMTPEWASPEQVLGQPVTTSTDVYSLGAILYKLLTSVHPYEGRTSSAFELEQAVVSAAVQKPSDCVRNTQLPADGKVGVARRLKGDLDTIVMKAMRREPARRYLSAEHLAEDIRRHMDGLPVTARGDSVPYRFSKFVTRHRTGVATAAFCVLALAGTAIVAQSERMRAERRFQELRQLANFVLHDLDDSLQTEGITPARRKVVARALQYLDDLARESAGDEALEHDVVNGYLKVGDVLGNAYQASLGETQAALASYRKALTVATRLTASNPAAANQRQQASATIKIADIQALSGNREEAILKYESAMKVYRELLESRPSERAALMSVLTVCTRLGSAREQTMDVVGALDTFRSCLPIAQRTASVDPAARRAVALVREQIASLSAKCGMTAGAEEEIKAAIAIYEQDVAENPGPRSQRNLAKGYKLLAEQQRSGRKYDSALVSVRRSLAISEDLLGRDPKDKRSQIDYHMALVLMIDLLHATNATDAARVETARVIRFLRPLVEGAEPALHDIQDYILVLVSTPFNELRDDAAALRFAHKAVEMTSRKDAESLDLLARALARSGDNRRAAIAEREALQMLSPVRPGLPVPEARTAMEANLRRFEAQLSTQAAAQSQNH